VPYQYLVFNKPFGVLSQFKDHQQTDHPTLETYIPIKQVYPVGRLDRDSEGLMLLTNHGQLQHRLSDPQFGHCRTYWVQVEGIPTPDALQALEQGVLIQGYRTQPTTVAVLENAPELPDRNPPIRFRQQIPTSWLAIALREGRNRQVRRMTAAVGFPTLRLVRVGIADLRLAGLFPGEWRYLSQLEKNALLRLTGFPA
jgi:23S rRNA pseudouridine2457 synthase